MTEGSGGCSGGVLALTEHLHELGVPIVWAYREDPSAVPGWATAVRAGTARHRWLAARSRWWLTDGLPMRVSGPDTVGRPLERSPGTVVMALVDPSVERVGSDIVDWPLLTPRQQRLLTVRGDMDVDLVAVPSRDTGVRQASALGFTTEAVVGTPLAERVPTRLAARSRLGIGEAAEVLGVVLQRSSPAWVSHELADSTGVSILSAGEGVTEREVIGACDVLVTDTSGWACVAARCDRPVIIVADDLRDLLSRGPGLYLPWQRALPGPFASSLVDVHRAVQAMRSEGWRVPVPYREGHSALANLAGPAPSGGCSVLIEALGVTP